MPTVEMAVATGHSPLLAVSEAATTGRGPMTGQNGCPSSRNTWVCDIHQDPGIAGRTFRISDNFRAAISLGPLAAGHSIVFPVASFRSIGDSLESPTMFGEFRGLVSDVRRALSERFPSQRVIAFEHGNASFVRKCNCSTEHAHLHLVPMNAPVMRRVRDAYFRWRDVTGFGGLVEMARNRHEYLYFEEDDTAIAAAVGEDPPPPQFFRRVVADALGVGDWNWKENPRYGVVEASLQKLRQLPD